ncbi:MAG TPA: DUF4331 family protein [Thermoanaerobaculia bacterium]|nr:DUF4331 family protein [Thermoanaerobaculia bacterium]
MRRYTARRTLSVALAALAAVWCAAPNAAFGSDHADTPLLVSTGRHDARITDLFAFTRNNRLVLILDTNPAIPGSVTTYAWPSDLKLQILIDNDSEVSFDHAKSNSAYGGSIVRPRGISEDVRFDIDFPNGTPRLKVKGIQGGTKQIRFFAGLRDDPFIRGPQIGKNIASIVIELPLRAVLKDSPTILLWGASRVGDVGGPILDLVGRSLRSQLGENLRLNEFHPKLHRLKLGMAPDVMIYDTTFRADFPNGRELTDDVIDLVAEIDPGPGAQNVLNTDAPFPSANDKPFLSTFPYLAEPHKP